MLKCWPISQVNIYGPDHKTHSQIQNVLSGKLKLAMDVVEKRKRIWTFYDFLMLPQYWWFPIKKFYLLFVENDLWNRGMKTRKFKVIKTHPLSGWSDLQFCFTLQLQFNHFSAHEIFETKLLPISWGQLDWICIFRTFLFPFSCQSD